jgi:hypothetical protein
MAMSQGIQKIRQLGKTQAFPEMHDMTHKLANLHTHNKEPAPVKGGIKFRLGQVSSGVGNYFRPRATSLLY